MSFLYSKKLKYFILKKLKNLDLQWNEITADGASALGNAKYFSNLKILRLWGNPIGEDGVRSIRESEDLKNVTNPIYPFASMDGQASELT